MKFLRSKIDIGALLAGSDIESGRKISKKCTACHSFEKGGPQKVGPNLWGIVGNKKAHLWLNNLPTTECG